MTGEELAGRDAQRSDGGDGDSHVALLTAPVLLRGVDRAAFAVALAVRLRGSGIPVGLTGAESFARVIGAYPSSSRSALYWAARISLVCRQQDIDGFDAAFAAVFDDVVLRADPIARRAPVAAAATADDVRVPPQSSHAAEEAEGGGLPWTTLPAATGLTDAPSGVLALPERLPSDLHALSDTPFDEIDADELALLGAWLDSAFANWPARRTRRIEPHRGGRRVDVRTTIARARRTGWEPLVLARSRPALRPRRIVMACDVSQSMQMYATAYLHLMRAATLSADAEVFAFATSLTRPTAVLAHSSSSLAIDQATTKVTDRFSGTRIAANIQALLDSRDGNVVRGAVVVVASDGWDSDPPDELARAMARLRRRAFRVVWLNPRAASPGWAPLVGAMAAALPFCDELFPAHTVRALTDAVGAISAYADRRRAV